MVDVRWTRVGDPETYALRVLRDEAPEIPAELLEDQQWAQLTMPVTTLWVDEEIHCQRRDAFVEAIRAGTELLPLVAINDDHHLVDGSARLRALRIFGVSEASVVVQI